MMMSIALTGGSPGSSPKTNTSTSVPTPPQSPSPIPPERTPRAMNPITTSPSSAINTQSVVLMSCSAPLAVAGRCSTRSTPVRARGRASPRRRASVTPLVSVEAIACAAVVSWSIDSSSVSASSSRESWAASRSLRGGVGPVGHLRGRLVALRRVGNAGAVDALDQRVRGLHGALEAAADEHRPSLRRLRLRLLLPQSTHRGRRANALDDRLHRSAPDADGTADALCPAARRDRLPAVVPVADPGGQTDHEHDAGERKEPEDRAADHRA